MFFVTFSMRFFFPFFPIIVETKTLKAFIAALHLLEN